MKREFTGLGIVPTLTPQSSSEARALAEVAAALSPGMAKVLEKLVASHFLKTRPSLTFDETLLLQCAGAALSVVNRTPGSAQQIGRGAAVAVSRNPDAYRLVEAVATLKQRRIA